MVTSAALDAMAYAGRVSGWRAWSMVKAVRSAGLALIVAGFCGWLLVVCINLIGLFALLLHVPYWTGGTHHDPMMTTLAAIAVVGCAPWLVLGLVGAFQRDPGGRSRRPALVVALVALLAAAANAVPYFIHVAEVQITASGFGQARYDTDEAYDLVLVNRTGAPVRVCAGRYGDCDGSDPPALASGGVVLRPGASRRIDVPAGTHRLTIAAGSPDLARPNATVKVNPGPSSSALASASSCVGAGGRRPPAPRTDPRPVARSPG
jgi:hypothetical protein